MRENEIMDAVKTKSAVIMPRKEVKAIIDAYFEVLREELEAGNKVAVHKFGIFSPVVKKARKGRNPKTGEAVEIPEKKSVRFKMSKSFFDQKGE